MRDITPRPEPAKLRKVMIATPCRDGRTDVNYTWSLAASAKLCLHLGIELCPVFIPGDALVQRARNDLLAMAVETSDITDLVWIDDDMGWSPEQLARLLSHDVDVVGGVCPKKSDEGGWNVKALDGNVAVAPNGLAVVECVGTGFLRMSRKAILALWEASQPYRVNGGPERRMVFDLAIVGGELVSEDNVACHVLRASGFDIFIDISITCSHTGAKTWRGDFSAWLKAVQAEEKIAAAEA